MRELIQVLLMTIISKGYCSDSGIEDTQWELFCRYIDLLLQYRKTILNCGDYFFCHLPFAAASFPYLQGDGPLVLGHLVFGWEQNILIEQCPACERKVLITSFAGSPLSGSNSWTGLCLSCRQKQSDKHSSAFRQWVDLILKLRQTFPAKVEQIEEYQGEEFTWGGSGLAPASKKRIVQVPVANPVTFAILIDELKTCNARSGNPVNVLLLKKCLELKPFNRN